MVPGHRELFVFVGAGGRAAVMVMVMAMRVRVCVFRKGGPKFGHRAARRLGNIWTKGQPHYTSTPAYCIAFSIWSQTSPVFLSAAILACWSLYLLMMGAVSVW